MARSDSGRATALGWCESLRSCYGFGFSATVSNHPRRACGRGFPSLFKEGNLKTQFRDRN